MLAKQRTTPENVDWPVIEPPGQSIDRNVLEYWVRHGLIETAWDAGPTDGLGAMVGAWWSASEAENLDCSLGDVQMMKEIQSYNEVDCKVMMEIIRYLKTSSPLSC